MAEVKKLLNGYREFYKKYYESGNTLYRDLTRHGQSPKTLIIACSDSRVDPSIITEAQPGDIFVVRNVANLVPPYQISDSSLHGVSAALEFAVRILDVNHIVVLGHSHCAGVKALLEQGRTEHTDFIGRWVSIATKARDKVLSEQGDAKEPAEHRCEKECILLSLQNLTEFPWIQSKVQARELKLHGWYFSIEDGKLLEYNATSGEFVAIPQS
ncbi:MAG: carbonic anhydrase [Rhodospirillales bacterium]|nr:carbonic anhydrase [Alphaproteobacteria bacterium]MCB1840679.1 carbonic anhydrase [Alphaproteobacteria bacterium]MCB9976539.1 carbonic anhydrase [Rhodospirillales bacterium]